MKNAPVTIRVLSVRQPAADHIIFGHKWCENRTWSVHYRGELFIHASRWDGSPDQPTPGDGVTGAIIGRVRLIDVVDLKVLLEDAASRRAIKPNTGKRRGQPPKRNRAHALRELARRHGLSARSENLEHVQGPICLILNERLPLAQPVAAKGQLNIWRFEAPPSRLQTRDVTV